MRYIIALVSLIWGSQSFVYAQHTVSGKVVNEKNESLSGSHIHADAIFTTTNSGGNYQLQLPSGESRIVISYIGYKTIDTVITVDRDLILNFQLQQDISALDEIVVVDQTLKSNTTISKHTLATPTIEKYSNASLGDLLKEISGVASLKTGNTIVKPVINGLHSSRVLIINNNVRLEDQQWGLEHAPNLDINTAGKVSVIKGASGLQYGGDAIGGVVVIEPAAVPLKDTLYGKTILNGASNGRGGSISSSLSKGYQSGWNWNVQGTFKYLGDVEAPDYVLSNTGNREKNFSGNLGYHGENSGFSASLSYYDATIGILRASHTGNIADLVAAINSGIPNVVNDFTYDMNAPRQEVQHYFGKADYYKRFDSGKFNVQYAFQLNNRLEYDLRIGDLRNTPSLDLALSTHSMMAGFETAGNGKSKYKMGFNATYQNNFADTATGVRPLIPDYNKYETGVFGIATVAVNDKLELEAGLRYDFIRMDAVKFYLKSRWDERGYDADFSNIIVGDFGMQWKTNPVFDYHNFSGSVGSKYQINSKTNWFVNLSLASRSPNPSELFSDGLHHSTGQIELGNLRLESENAVKISTSLEYVDENWSVIINPYLNLINNFTVLEPTGVEQTIRGAFPVWEYRQVNAKLAGLDLTAAYDFSESFSLQTNLAYVYGEDSDTDEALIDMPPLNWSNTLQFKKDWNDLVLELRSESVFTQNRFPNNDFIADVPVDGEFVPILVQISQPPKGYQQLHFSSSIGVWKRGNSKMTLGFKIHNIFNTNYRDYLNRTRFYADDMGRNVMVQLKFNY